MEKQSSNQVLIKKPLSGVTTNRYLVIQSKEFIDYLKGYEQWLKVLGYAKSTVYYFPSYLRSFFFFLEEKGIQRLAKVRSTHIGQFLCSLSQKINEKTGILLSKNYQLNHLNALKRFSTYLADCHNIIIDFSEKVTSGTLALRRWLTLEEIKSLYDSCDFTSGGITNRAILSVYYGLGLRRSEGIALDVNDIINRDGVAYVRKGKFNKERYVPMTASIYSDIIKYITTVRTMLKNKYHRYEEPALLLSENGTRFTGNAIYERLQCLAKNAGVNTPLPLHSLRHSVATHLLHSGMSLENISIFLGHSSLESTQIYTHLIQNPLYNEKLL